MAGERRPRASSELRCLPARERLLHVDDVLDDVDLVLRVVDAVDDVDILDMFLLRGVDVAGKVDALELREEVEALRSFLETRFTEPGFRQEPMRMSSLSPIVFQLERPAGADDFTFRKS